MVLVARLNSVVFSKFLEESYVTGSERCERFEGAMCDSFSLAGPPALIINILAFMASGWHQVLQFGSR